MVRPRRGTVDRHTEPDRRPARRWRHGETRCYVRDPDGYIIEVGQSKPEFTYG